MVLPNQLTILRIILTPFFLVFFLSGNPLMKQISLGIFIIAALTDWYDGWLARKFNYITSWGRLWDPLADKILTSAAFLGFAFLNILQFWMVIVILIRDLLITTLRAYADYKKSPFPTSRYAKWKTFIQMSFLYYLLIVYVSQNTAELYKGNEKIFSVLLNEHFIYFTMLFITAITFHSGVTYVYKNRYLITKLFEHET